MYGTTPNSIRMFFAEKYQVLDMVVFEQTDIEQYGSMHSQRIARSRVPNPKNSFSCIAYEILPSS